MFIKNTQKVVIFRLLHNISFWRESLGRGCKWDLQVSDGNGGYRSVGTSDSSKSKTWDTGIDLNVENLVVDGEPVTIHIGQPVSNLDQYHVTVDGVLVARATRFTATAKSSFSSWRIDITQGFDLALVCCNDLHVEG